MTEETGTVPPDEQEEPNPRQVEGPPQLPKEPPEVQSDVDRDSRADDVMSSESGTEPRH